MLLGIKYLLLCSITSFFLGKKYKNFFIILIISQISIYLFILGLSPLDLYSDREQYAYWFSNIEEQLNSHHDVVFIFWMKILSFYNEENIWYFLMYGITILFMIFVVAKNYLSSNYEKISVLLLLLIPNRFFLEYSMNSMRAFFLVIIYLTIMYFIVYRKKFFLLIILPLLFFIHKGLFLLLSLVFLGAYLIKNIYFIKPIYILFTILFVIGININLLDSFISINLSTYLNMYAYGTTDKFLETENNYHLLARIQIFLNYMLPSYFLIYKYSDMDEIDKRLCNYFLFISIVVLIISLTLPIVFRIYALLLILNFLMFAKYFNKNSYLDIAYILVLFTSASLIYIKDYKGLI